MSLEQFFHSHIGHYIQTTMFDSLFHGVLCLHCHHGEDDGGVGSLGNIGPASEGGRVEVLGHSSQLWLRHRDSKVYLKQLLM